MKTWELFTIGGLVVAVIRSFSTDGASSTGQVETLAYAISKAEGYGVAGAIPTVRNNPGNIRARSGEIATYDTPEVGWAALYRQIEAMLADTSGLYPADWSLAQVAARYTGEGRYMDWVSNVLYYLNERGVQAGPDTTFREIGA